MPKTNMWLAFYKAGLETRECKLKIVFLLKIILHYNLEQVIFV